MRRPVASAGSNHAGGSDTPMAHVTWPAGASAGDQPHGHLGGGWLRGSLVERHDAHQRPGLGRTPGCAATSAGDVVRARAGQHALLVGSRTGAVPAWVRLQPPPHRTAQTDFPYAALLSALRHGLCDLSTRSAFGRSPISDPIVSEELEPFMEPHRTPPLPAEAATAPRPHQMAPHSLLDPQPHIGQAPARVPDPEVVHPPPKDRVDLRDQPTPRL